MYLQVLIVLFGIIPDGIIIELIMKIIKIYFIFCTFFVPFVFSQNGIHIDGGDFTKIIEYNMPSEGYDDYLKIEGLNDIFLFSGSNAPVEFLYNHPFNGLSGFRLVRDSLNFSYYIETKRITNYLDVSNSYRSMYQSLGIPPNLLPSIPADVRAQIIAHHRKTHPNYFEGISKRINVKTQSIHVSDQFAETLYEYMVSLIDNFQAKRTPQTVVDGVTYSRIIVDGEVVFLKTVVDDEVWSLSIHVPRGNASKMSDICLQIIEVAENNQLDEMKFVSLFKTFEIKNEL